MGHHACPKSTCTQSELCDMLCNLVTITILCFSKCLTKSIDLYENFIKFPWCVKNWKTWTFWNQMTCNLFKGQFVWGCNGDYNLIWRIYGAILGVDIENVGWFLVDKRCDMGGEVIGYYKLSFFSCRFQIKVSSCNC